MVFITTACKEAFEEITDEHGGPRHRTDRKRGRVAAVN